MLCRLRKKQKKKKTKIASTSIFYRLNMSSSYLILHSPPLCCADSQPLPKPSFFLLASNSITAKQSSGSSSWGDRDAAEGDIPPPLRRVRREEDGVRTDLRQRPRGGDAALRCQRQAAGREAQRAR
jgi:hypothetical protein